MLTFLRNIRKSFVGSRSVRNYLLYSFGEILLVVIGILLALQINNWNEDRISDNIEKEYLDALKQEFETNKEKLDYFISLNLELIETAMEFLKHTGEQSRTNITENQINTMFVDLIKANVEYEPSPGILEDLISSGNLNKLSNTTLRKQLSDWKARLAKVRRQESTVLEYRSNIKNLLIEKGNTRTPLTNLLQIDSGTFSNKNSALLTDKQLENNLSFFAISSLSLSENYYGDLANLIGEILETIQKQLSNQ